MSHDNLAGRVLAYLRMPQFGPTNRRTPGAAVLHALPAFLLMAINLWVSAMGLCWFIAAYFSLPTFMMISFMVVAAVPSAPLTWAILVRCIEVEADLDE